MGAEKNPAAVVGNLEIGVVVFAVREPSHRVDEGHGPIVVGEVEDFGDAFTRARPAGQERKQALDLLRGEPVAVRLPGTAASIEEIGKRFHRRPRAQIAESIILGRRHLEEPRMGSVTTSVGKAVIEISEAAQAHFRRLIEAQEEPELGIRLSVIRGGTPAADCRLEFCAPAELSGGEVAIPCDGFTFWVEAAALPYLEGARIDLKPEGAGTALSIRAPRLRGVPLGPEAPLADRVRDLIEREINPHLARHRGRVELVELQPEGVAIVRFSGGCQGCGMVDQTLREGIVRVLRDHFPEIVQVVDATDHAAGTDPYLRQRR